jgi:hypothetical protein
MAAVFAAFSLSPLACGFVLGIDSGTLRGDASSPAIDVDVPESGDDVTASDGGLPFDATLPDGGFVPDGGFHFDAAGEAGCMPDPAWCATRCGSTTDNCGQPRVCPDNCAPNVCNPTTHACECQSKAGWCSSFCGKTTDNCGKDVDCGNCDGGLTCTSNACGCVPEPKSTTCGSRQCGTAKNNCNQDIPCGVNNSVSCDLDAGQKCLPATDTCCTPNASACNGRCQTQVTDNCGGPLPCMQCPLANQVCVNTNCCTVSYCTGSCVDNCNQYNPSCCPPPPPDSGPPPMDGGCAGPNQSCTVTGCCPGLLCGSAGTCVPMCGQSGAPCNQPADCCYKLTCSGVATPAAASSITTLSIMPVDGGISLGNCQ